MTTRALQTEGRIESIDPIELQRLNDHAVNGTPSFARENSFAQILAQGDSPIVQSSPPSRDIRAQTAMLRKAFASHEAANIGHASDDLGRERVPDNLIKNADDAVLACQQLKALAEATQSYLEQFADVKISPWLPSLVGTTSRSVYESDNSLHELRRIATRILSILEEARNFGVNSVQDLEQLIAADKDLPDETPPGHLVKVLNNVDTVRFSILLGQHRKLLKLLEELDSAPDLSSAPTEALVRASNVAAIAAKSEYVQLLPAQAFSEAVKRSEDAHTLMSVVESATTALGLLGFDRSFPASGLDAVALAVIVAARLPPSYLNYFRWSSSGGADAFRRAHERWSELVSVDAEWQERLSGYSPRCRPSPEELETAAAHFAGSTIRKARAEFAGAGLAARELIAPLGLDPRSARIRDDLESLIIHLRAVRRFCTNTTYHEMLGSEWAGLETPFDDIATAARAIQRIKSYFITVAHGRRVFDRLVLLEAFQLKAMGSLASSMGELRALSNNLKSRFDERTVEALISELESEQHLAETILKADPERLTASIDLPLSKIYEISAREILRRELADDIARDPLAPAVNKLANSDETAEAALKATTWIGIIRRKELAPELQSHLLSANAVQVREHLGDLSNRAATILRIFDGHISKFEEQYKLHGLSSLSLPDLLTRIDDLIAKRNELPAVGNMGQNGSGRPRGRRSE